MNLRSLLDKLGGRTLAVIREEEAIAALYDRERATDEPAERAAYAERIARHYDTAAAHLDASPLARLLTLADRDLMRSAAAAYRRTATTFLPTTRHRQRQQHEPTRTPSRTTPSPATTGPKALRGKTPPPGPPNKPTTSRATPRTCSTAATAPSPRPVLRRTPTTPRPRRDGSRRTNRADRRPVQRPKPTNSKTATRPPIRRNAP